jgi:hypothetical protein
VKKPRSTRRFSARENRLSPRDISPVFIGICLVVIAIPILAFQSRQDLMKHKPDLLEGSWKSKDSTLRIGQVQRLDEHTSMATLDWPEEEISTNLEIEDGVAIAWTSHNRSVRLGLRSRNQLVVYVSEPYRKTLIRVFRRDHIARWKKRLGL